MKALNNCYHGVFGTSTELYNFGSYWFSDDFIEKGDRDTVVKVNYVKSSSVCKEFVFLRTFDLVLGDYFNFKKNGHFLQTAKIDFCWFCLFTEHKVMTDSTIKGKFILPQFDVGNTRT